MNSGRSDDDSDDGAAGFIAANMIEELLQRGNVVVIDNLSLGSWGNVDRFSANENFQVIEHDLSKVESTTKLFQAIHARSEVWHLAANSDISSGVESPEIDLKDTLMTTHCVLVAMRAIDTKKL